MFLGVLYLLWKGDPINELRISWTGVGIFFQAGAVNEVNDDSYSIITNYSYPKQFSYSSYLLLFLNALNYNIKTKLAFLFYIWTWTILLNSFQSSFLKFVLEKNLMCNGLQRLEKGNITWVLYTKNMTNGMAGLFFLTSPLL